MSNKDISNKFKNRYVMKLVCQVCHRPFKTTIFEKLICSKCEKTVVGIKEKYLKDVIDLNKKEEKNHE